MQNNKTYLDKLGIACIITILAGIASTLLIEQFIRNSSVRSEYLYLVITAISILTSLVNIGLTTKKWNAVAGMFVAHIIMQCLNYFVFADQEGGSRNLIFWIRIAGYFIPYVVFFLFLKPKQEKLPTILLCLLLIFGTGGVFRFDEGFDWFTELFFDDWSLPDYVPRFISFVVAELLPVILLNELVNYNEGKAQGYSPRIINPGNEYSKLNGTIIFWVFKIFLYLSLFGCFTLLRSFGEFRYDSGSISYLQWYFLFSLISTAGLMLVSAWYLRKFLLEFFISYNFSSRFLYWFLLLPVLGFVAWLVMIADCNKQGSFTERKAVIEKFSSSSRSGVIAILVIGLVIRLLAGIESSPGQALIIFLLSGLLLIGLISSTTGYYLNLYLNLLLLAVIILLPLFGGEMRIGPALFPFLMLNLFQLVLVFPVMHFESFNYLSYEEEKPWQPGDDLF